MAATPPINHMLFQSVEGSAARGGWMAGVQVINDQELLEKGDRFDFFVRTEAWGSIDPVPGLMLRGTLMPQSINFDYRSSAADATVSTSNIFLENAGLQGIYFAVVDSPSNPHQSTHWNLGKIVEHIIEDHTNISLETPGGWVDTAGIDTLYSSSVNVYTVRQSQSIWSTIEQIASNEFYVRYFDKQDRFWYQPHPQFTIATKPIKILLTADNIANSIIVNFRQDQKIDQVQLYGLTDTGVILKSFYPSTIGTEARRERYSSLRCNSQARLDVLALRAFKFHNRDVGVVVTIPNAYGAYLELYDRVAITYTGTTANGVTINWTAKAFWITRISIQRTQGNGALTELELEEELL